MRILNQIASAVLRWTRTNLDLIVIAAGTAMVSAWAVAILGPMWAIGIVGVALILLGVLVIE
jgi:hypothetical protein